MVPRRVRAVGCLFFGTVLACALAASAADWPQWGGRNERNFVSDEKGIPDTFRLAGEKTVTEKNDQGETVERKVSAPAENIKWVAKLGSKTYGNPTVAGGRIFVGTNDAGLNDPRLKKTQGGMVLCLEEATGKVLWQLPIPRLKTKDPLFNYDNMSLGVCSSPAVDGDRVYVVTNRGEVLCLDVQGQANGNDGPFQDEGQYLAGTGDLPGKPGRFDKSQAPPAPPPVEVRPTDGDIVWIYDFLAEVDSWPQDAVDCSVLVYGDYVYVCPSNGVNRTHNTIPSPNCPDLLVLDKKTGKLAAVNDPPIGKAIFHGEWSSPTLAKVGGKTLIVWGGGDGFCYAFDAKPEPRGQGKPALLKQVWKFDCNPPHNRLRDGKPLPYNKNREGPSEVLGTPVVCQNRIYVTVGQDSRHGNGPGCLSCIDATQTGDIWGSTFAVDGKVYIGDEKGKVTVFALAKEKKVLCEASLGVQVYATPIAANGVLYIACETHLYAIAAPKP
jgi:outer membrane protein assembly factor BamB